MNDNLSASDWVLIGLHALLALIIFQINYFITPVSSTEIHQDTHIEKLVEYDNEPTIEPIIAEEVVVEEEVISPLTVTDVIAQYCPHLSESDKIAVIQQLGWMGDDLRFVFFCLGDFDYLEQVFTAKSDNLVCVLSENNTIIRLDNQPDYDEVEKFVKLFYSSYQRAMHNWGEEYDLLYITSLYLIGEDDWRCLTPDDIYSKYLERICY